MPRANAENMGNGDVRNQSASASTWNSSQVGGALEFGSIVMLTLCRHPITVMSDT